MNHNWEYKRLMDVCGVQYGFAFNSTFFNEDRDGLPLVRIRDVVRGFSETFFKGEYATDYIVRNGDYLIGMDGEFNIARWKSEDALLNQRVCRIEAKNVEQVAMQFMYYFLTMHLKEIENETPFVTVKHLSAKRINQIVAPVPPLAIQKQIVMELDRICEIIEKKKQQIKELNTLAQSLFYEMFGDPVENEKGWEVKKVIDVVTFQRGYDLPVQNRNANGGIPIFGANGIVGYHSESMSQRGIITGRSGSLGDVFVSKKPYWPLNTSLFSKDTHGNDIVYLMYLVRYFDLKRYKQGAGVPTLNRNSFHHEPIIDVPLPLQQSFAEKIEAIERQKELINQSIKEAQTLFDSRMEHYFGN